MNPTNIYVQGSYIDIHDNQNVYLSCDKAAVHLDRQPVATDVAPPADTPAQTPDGQLTALMDGFTDEQVRASGIRCQPRVALAMMALMQPQCRQKVDWLSFYSVLLLRRWVDGNVRAWCRMVEGLFGIALDPRTLANDLANQGSTDYRLWTDADRRIVRRKQLAVEFDNRLAEYFERGRSAVLEGVR